MTELTLEEKERVTEMFDEIREFISSIEKKEVENGRE